MYERFTGRARRVVVLAQEEARMLNHNYIGTEHILLGLIREGEGVAAQVLVKLGADPGSAARPHVNKLLRGYQGNEPAAAYAPSEAPPSVSLVLDQFGRNLTAGAREGKLDPVIGREKEIERVMQVLCGVPRTTRCWWASLVGGSRPAPGSGPQDS
jgi:ATP-dependent Clp protease ATP-binding subunit ClpC